MRESERENVRILRTSGIVLAGVIGMVLGALLMVAALVFNPFVRTATLAAPITAADPAGHTVETFTVRAPEDIIAVTHNGSNIIDPRPGGIALLEEPALQSGLLLVAKVRNADGEIVGVAVESEETDPVSNPLLGRMRMNTDWTILLPSRGTIFLTQIEDAGSVGKEILPAVILGGWNGQADFVSTAGPNADGRGLIVGGTREFHGITGSFVELSHLTHMSRGRGGVGTVELQLAYKSHPPAK
jgi:hypothetical protein